MLDGKPVRRISTYLVEGEQDDTPAPLRANAGISFQGSILLGMGFTFDDETNDPSANRLSEMQRLIAKQSRNAERIRPYIGGEEVNDSPTHAYHRYAIDFFDFPLCREDVGNDWASADERQRQRWLTRGTVPLDYSGPVANDWPDLLEIVRNRVKPDRDKQTREVLRLRWWQYAEKRPGLLAAIRNLDRVLVTNRGASPHLGFVLLPANLVYANTLNVFATNSFGMFSILQSRVQEIWARFFGSSLTDRLAYTIPDCFESFPLPASRDTIANLEDVGKEYHEFRASVMRSSTEGLTPTYNRFADPENRDPAIIRLRELHAAMDRAVLVAYGWTDMNPGAIHEREWEAEEGEKLAPWRLRWPEPVRDEVLARLLDLNRRLHEEESQEIPPPNPPRRGRGRNAPPGDLTLLD